MRKVIGLPLVLVLTSLISFAQGADLSKLSLAQHTPDLDASVAEINAYVRSHPRALLDADLFSALEDTTLAESPLDEDLTPVLDAGKRLYDWVDFMNKARPADHRLSLSSPETQVAYPIDSPRVYNPAIVKNQFASFKNSAPASLLAVLTQGAAFTQNPPMSDADFVTASLPLDRVYAIATRWLMAREYLPSYRSRKQSDVRGYYHLSQEPNLNGKLQGFGQLPQADQDKISGWLLGLCQNSEGSGSSCSSKLRDSIARASVLDFYREYSARGQELYEGFFRLAAVRDDVRWTSADPMTMFVPFVKPDTREIQEFLSGNIEDEWKWKGWQLKLQFGADSGSTPQVVFEPGVVPHVNGLGGNTITMDSNEPLSEYNVRWTIRHEFGHVLGFPDCYIEFYDDDVSAMVSYQLDITNLMCSRRGHLKQTHYDELKSGYGPKSSAAE